MRISSSVRRALTVTSAVLAITAAASTTAVAAAPVGLSVTLTDGVQQVHSDQDVTYLAKLANAGGKRITARLVLDLPAYVDVKNAHGGRVAKRAVTWNVAVRGGKAVTETVDVHLGRIAAGELRVTTLASVYQKGSRSSVPLIRTADADRIDGVKDPARTITQPTRSAKHAKSESSTRSGSDTNFWLVAGLPAALVLLLGAGGYGWRRRRRGADVQDPSVADEPAMAGTGVGDRADY